MTNELKEKRLSKKERFLRGFSKRMCNVSATCKAVGISRQTFYRWCDRSDNFKKQIEDAQEEFYDDLEMAMNTKALIDKDTGMLIWLSKTKMKHRGYVEKIDQNVTINPFEELMKSLPDA